MYITDATKKLNAYHMLELLRMPPKDFSNEEHMLKSIISNLSNINEKEKSQLEMDIHDLIYSLGQKYFVEGIKMGASLNIKILEPILQKEPEEV